MLKVLAAVGFGALVALTAFDASAQSTPAPANRHHGMQRPGGSYRSHHHWRRNQPRVRAQATSGNLRNPPPRQ